jgi:hypothetical protein
LIPGSEEAQEALFLSTAFSISDDELPAFLHTAPARFRSLPWTGPLEARGRLARRIRELHLIDAGQFHAQGTSVAAPLVTGALAQLLEAAPDLTPRQAKALLLETAVALPSVPAALQGAGVVNPRTAVKAATEGTAGAPHSVPGFQRRPSRQPSPA